MVGNLLLLAPSVLVASLLVIVDGTPQYYSNYGSYSSYSPYYTNYYSRSSYGRDLFKRGRSISDIEVRCGAHTCGAGAHCVQGSVRPVCACLAGHSGDALLQCIRIECVDNSECPSHQTCVNQHCVNPCKNRCGTNANCNVRDHQPICTCLAGYTGKPEFACRIADPEEACHPSPCGPNTECHVSNNGPVCKCFAGYFPDPAGSGCRHECESDQQCGPQHACREFKCVSPCKDCGKNANCESVAGHRASCKCLKGYHGDPYRICSLECTTDSECPSYKPTCKYNACVNPCTNYCGTNAECNLRGSSPACTCLSGYYGIATEGCERGECELDSQCPDHLACVSFQCIDPCLGNTQCGSGGVCMGRGHLAVCTCPQGGNGDALVNCYATRSGAASTRYFRFRRNGVHGSKKNTTIEGKVERQEPKVKSTTEKPSSEAKPVIAEIRYN